MHAHIELPYPAHISWIEQGVTKRMMFASIQPQGIE